LLLFLSFLFPFQVVLWSFHGHVKYSTTIQSHYNARSWNPRKQIVLSSQLYESNNTCIRLKALSFPSFLPNHAYPFTIITNTDTARKIKTKRNK
jgi:hypothetical protein